ncbi:MAG: hypothetical protein IID37_16590 [Planctomycetes bacterium]|nr:hypothetical protein [Planctomycetota bacterium]
MQCALMIEGQLEITGDSPANGSFPNYGTVHANVAGTLLISTGAFDDDVDLDLDDYAAFQSAFTGPTAPNLNPNGPG